MENIALERDKQKKLNKKVKSIKKQIKSQNIILKDKAIKRKSNKIRKINKYWKSKPIIYLSHIPHGFYEEQMLSYFSQFGKVLSANVARSSKTGRSRGFGFVEFANEEVAKIAAEAMNNYLMYRRVLKCQYIPPEERKKTQIKIVDPKNHPGKINKSKDLRKKNLAISKLKDNQYKAKALQKAEQLTKFFENQGISFSLKVGDVNVNPKFVNKKNENSCKTIKTNCNESGEVNVLEVDESDNEIHFTTPPNVKKIFKKSLDSEIKRKEGGKPSKIKLSQVSETRKKNKISNKIKKDISRRKMANKLKSKVSTKLIQAKLRNSNQSKKNLKKQKL